MQIAINDLYYFVSSAKQTIFFMGVVEKQIKESNL